MTQSTAERKAAESALRLLGLRRGLLTKRIQWKQTEVLDLCSTVKNCRLVQIWGRNQKNKITEKSLPNH